MNKIAYTIKDMTASTEYAVPKAEAVSKKVDDIDNTIEQIRLYLNSILPTNLLAHSPPGSPIIVPPFS